MSEPNSISIIIPTFNGAARIGRCLAAILGQAGVWNAEILVVNDGSTDATAEVVSGYSGIRLINQTNAGPAAARNRGAHEASGTIILFTDDDCEPAPNWLDAMLESFLDPEVIGVKGTYLSRQRQVMARFVQCEYADRYRMMAGLPSIDFVDTYSAAFRRDNFLQMGGYDTSFPVACAEDIDLSYRMSARGWKMKFAPAAVVFHTHPATLSGYLRKKYKFAFWRVLALRKNPQKAVKDSHTPQLMKFQLLFLPALVTAILFDLAARPHILLSLPVLIAFGLSALPFAVRAVRRDVVVGLLSPLLLAARACAQMLGIAAGLVFAGRTPAALTAKSAT